MAMALLTAAFAPRHSSFALHKLGFDVVRQRCDLTARRSAQNIH